MSQDRFSENYETVMTTDLNNVHRDELNSAQFCAEHLNMLIPSAHAAFFQNYHLDNSNAAIHLAGVKFSPITFRLAVALEGLVNDTGEIEEVLAHRGRYEEDPGR
jgi:hypothetical protein